MHHHDLRPYQTHHHDFELGNPPAERRTWIVVALTSAMMVAEIAVGVWSGSMALLADGWHMATHAGALGVTGLAYWLARRERHDQRYAFGTWKIEVLGGFASAVVLAVVALYVAVEALQRMFVPVQLRYEEAIAVATIGLGVNVICALLLHHHAHGHSHGHEHGLHAHDLNLRAAYLHVAADALTSLFAIGALLGARLLGWRWLDPVMGLVGAALIAVWAVGLIRQTSRVLLDREMAHPLVGRVRAALEEDGDTRVCDLHVWRVGRAQFAAVASVVSDHDRQPAEYKQRLASQAELVHLTVEVLRCREHTPVA